LALTKEIIMPRSAEELLEFSRLREIVCGFNTCAPGRRAVESLAFTQNRAKLNGEFALIREAREWLRGGNELGFGALADPDPWLTRLEPGASEIAASATVLTPAELLDAASLLDTSAWLKTHFREARESFSGLAALAESLADFRHISTAIRKTVLPDGTISDDASPELRRIRGTLARTRDSIQKSLREIQRSRGAETGEDYVTLRNDRYVIPVRAADRQHSSVKNAIVHGASATGQTVYVEPLAAIELNNKLVQLAEDESAEIARILEAISELLRGNTPALRHAADTIAELDSLFARGRYARQFDCALPVFAEPSSGTRAQMKLDGARHPVLEAALRREGGRVVPMSLAMGGGETVLVISGPNTGGKTVALKTVGLAALAAQSGIPVTAQSAELPLFDNVLADIGDEQSIAANLSTFSAHMLNLRGMLAAVTQNSLVLVDELGTGTAPEEGAALAVALLEEFRTRHCLTLATTHHDRLKAYASTTPGVLNAAVEFDTVNLRPTYRLLVGVPGGSSGIAIAERLGLPHHILERARAEMSPAAHEAADLISYLHGARDEVDSLRAAVREQSEEIARERKLLQTEWADRQRKRIAELEQKFAEVLKQHETTLTQALEAIRERELRVQLTKQTQRSLTKSRADAREEVDTAVVQHLDASQQDLGAAVKPVEKPVQADRLVPGVKIRVRGFPSPVVLRRIDARGAEVEAGPLRMKIVLDDILSIMEDTAGAMKSSQPAQYSPGVTVKSQPTDEPSADEINVIGCTVEQATERVDKFLDQAAVSGKTGVRIIHGHGTGALRRGLADFLSGHPLVEKIANEIPERGGAAITLVTMKD
jgi:DNA mismatch repair protein MutS2